MTEIAQNVLVALFRQLSRITVFMNHLHMLYLRVSGCSAHIVAEDRANNRPI